MEKYIKKFFILLLLLVFTMYILEKKIYAYGPDSSTIYEGIDVSGWQETINYVDVKNSGIDIVYMKASQGTNYKDPYFEENYANAKANGLKVGFYHYLTARSIEEANLEAEFFTRVIGGKTVDCRLAMDFESFGNLTVEEINLIGLTFMKRVEEETNIEMIIYSDTNNATNVFSGELTNYPLWVAQYEESEPTPNGNWSSWAGWQYTDQGEISGISGYVDRDKFTSGVLLDSSKQTKEKEGDNRGTTIITIQWGDTLSQIAAEYNTTVEELVFLNNIQNLNLIYAGNTLIVPTKEMVDNPNKQRETGMTYRIYIVKRGDTLNKIAASYDTTVSEIAKINNIRNVNLIYVGQRLKIPTNISDLNHILYKVRWGDTLWSLSRRYHVPIATIVRLNRIQNPNLIYANSILRI